ncbi:MAG: TetR family transcriptional regulator [Proteobacteria bacterium]|nr:TetR family transcriptional regulator [Pseudomonadota bacterium]
MKIKDLEAQSGVPRTTIHFYLRQGLLHPPEKTGRTTATYDQSHLVRLRKIKTLKKGGRVPLRFLQDQLAEDKAAPIPSPDNENTPIFGKPSATMRERKEKHRMIIRKAIEVFSKNGYHKTKIADITSALKISTGTFYIYFRNKRDLFIEVIDEVFRTIVGEAVVALKGEMNFVERMRIRGQIFYSNYAKYHELLTQLRAEMTRESIWPAEKIKAVYHGLTLPVIRDIQAAIDAGVIRPIDPDLAAYALTGQIEIMSLRRSLDEKYTIHDIEKFLIEGFIKPMLV